MPQLLAIEWNRREVRVAVASGRGRQAVLEQAFAFPAGAEGPEPPEQRLGAQIAKQLDARGIGRPEALVAVGRTSIELRQLQLPPSPDEELPDLVRFQAAREFNDLDARWLLDFVPTDQPRDGPRSVLAAAIAPAMVQQIETVCQAAGLKMRRLLLRPCEAASLLAAGKAGSPLLQLLVDLSADEADLTAVLDGKAVFLRTARFGGDPPPAPALLAEIRLTMAAAQNQLGQKVQAIVLLGQDRTHADLARSIQAELGMPVELFDPLAGLELSAGLKDSLPEQPGRFAPLVGMLLAELRPAGHAIDFLHPRRRAASPSRRKKWIMAGATAAVLLLAYLVYARIDHYLLAEEVARLQAESRTLDESMARGKKVRTTVAEIAKWADAEVVWLDQLHALSQGFPPAEDAVLGQLTLGVRQGGSQMDLKGWVRNAEVIGKMEEDARARSGQISGKSSREDNSVKPYSWWFEASVMLGAAKKP